MDKNQLFGRKFYDNKYKKHYQFANYTNGSNIPITEDGDTYVDIDRAIDNFKTNKWTFNFSPKYIIYAT